VEAVNPDKVLTNDPTPEALVVIFPEMVGLVERP
jgi:hypothetical protein